METTIKKNLCDGNVAKPSAQVTQTLPVQPFTINSNVILPTYRSLDHVPFTQWEIVRSKQLLEVNGFDGDSIDSWRQAAVHDSLLLRETAYYLLIQSPILDDAELFCHGLADLNESVQVLAAYGLYQLGDQSHFEQLYHLAYHAKVEFAALRAAGLLGGMGYPQPFEIVINGLNQEKSLGTRVMAAESLYSFVKLHGAIYHGTETIDIWQTYSQAIVDAPENIYYVIAAQLDELNTPEAQHILQEITTARRR